MKSFLFMLVFALLAACSKPAEMPVEQTEDTAPPVTAAESGKEPATEATSQSSHDIDGRVADSKARLMATPAGKIVWESIEAHGGLAHWFKGGNLAFRFNYAPLGKKPNDTRQVIDLWNARARHTLTSNPEVSFGWDGQQTWVSPANAEVGTNPRFWSLTPYYFVGVPFVLGDPGVKLAIEAPVEFEGKTYDTVRVTFEDGTGDASGDFYVMYFDQQTRKVRGLRYIVTYKGFFPDGGHSPEKFMAYDGEQDIDGIKLPTTFRTFTWDGAKNGDLVTNVTLSEVTFQPDFSDFEVPKDGRVVEGY